MNLSGVKAPPSEMITSFLVGGGTVSSMLIWRGGIVAIDPRGIRTSVKAPASNPSFKVAEASRLRKTLASAMPFRAEMPRLRLGMRWASRVPVALTLGLAESLRAGSGGKSGVWWVYSSENQHTCISDVERPASGMFAAWRKDQFSIFNLVVDSDSHVHIDIQNCLSLSIDLEGWTNGEYAARILCQLGV